MAKGSEAVEQTIYGDILFAVNFSMDFLALDLTAAIMKLKFSFKRVLFAALLGGGYGVLAAVVRLGLVLELFSLAVVGVLMCLFAFGWDGWLLFLKKMLFFLSVNLLLGGGMTALYSWFNYLGAEQDLLIFGQLETVQEQLPFSLFVMGAVAVALISILFGRLLARRRSIRRATLVLEHEGRQAVLNALEDSGNLLVEPFSGEPVVIIGKSAARELFSRDMLLLLEELRPRGEYAAKTVRFVVSESVGGRKAFAVLRPNRILVNGEAVSAWLGVAGEEFFGPSKEFEASIPSALLQT